jgi:hypothetical protein
MDQMAFLPFGLGKVPNFGLENLLVNLLRFFDLGSP